MGEHGAVIAGESIRTGCTFEVRSPFDRSLVALMHNAGPSEIERAIDSAVRGFDTTRTLPAWKRAAVLETVSRQIEQRREQLARVVAAEAGKPIKTARLEVDRAAFTFKVGSEEGLRCYWRGRTFD